MSGRRAVSAVVGLLAFVAVGAVLLDDRDGGAPDTVPVPNPTTSSPSAEGEQEGEASADADNGRSEWVVSPNGSDEGSGSADDPFETVEHAMEQLEPGDTLVVRGGTYREQVILEEGDLNPGSVDAPITVEAHPGERPVIEGLLWLSGADHWTLRGVNVTWSSENDSDEHMVKFLGGTGWRFTEAEVWDARSFAAILVSSGARDFRLDHLFVHDTHPSNDENQDHLLYVASGNTGGIIERNVLARSPNGRGLKVGPGSLDDAGSDGLVIRYNTFFDNTGPSNIRFSGESSDNLVYRNLFTRSGDGEAAVTSYRLEGEGNVVRDNAAWEVNGVVATTDGLVDGGGNVIVEPDFVDKSDDNFRPTAPEAARYGAHAPAEE